MDKGARGLDLGERRRARAKLLLDTTRELFDERGLQEAPLEEVAAAVGINRALIYRHFDSKEELFVLTMTRYLDEITQQGLQRIEPAAAPADKLEQSWGSFVDYCLRYPAFVDCALSLMRRPAAELRELLSESAWSALGESMSRSLGVTAEIIRRGIEEGAFAVEDPDMATNLLYAQTIGLLQSARIGLGVAHDGDGRPTAFEIGEEDVRAAAIAAAIAAVRAPTPGAPASPSPRGAAPAGA